MVGVILDEVDFIGDGLSLQKKNGYQEKSGIWAFWGGWRGDFWGSLNAAVFPFVFCGFALVFVFP